MPTQDQAPHIRNVISATLNRSAQLAGNVHVTIVAVGETSVEEATNLDNATFFDPEGLLDEVTSIGPEKAWQIGIAAHSGQMLRNSHEGLATFWRAVARTVELTINDTAEAGRLGASVLPGSTYASSLLAPASSEGQRRLIRTGANGKLSITSINRNNIEATEIFQAGRACSSDLENAAALFVWITGLTDLRAISAQSLELFAWVLPTLPPSFGKGRRHWSMSLETAIKSIAPTGPRRDPERCDRHVRSMLHLLLLSRQHRDFELLTKRVDPDTGAFMPDEAERKLILGLTQADVFVLIVKMGGIKAARGIRLENFKKEEEDKAGFDKLSPKDLAGLFKQFNLNNITGKIGPSFGYGSRLDQFMAAARFWLSHEGSCVICKKSDESLTDLVCLDKILLEGDFISIKNIVKQFLP